VIFVLGFFFLTGAVQATTRRVEIEVGMVAVLTDEGELRLEALPLRGEGVNSFATRLTASRRNASTITRENGGVRKLLQEVRYRVPYDLLTDRLKLAVLRTLFPDDRPIVDGWEHTVKKPDGESLWRLADWFTGTGRNFAAIRSHNRLVDESLDFGQRVVIPSFLLLAHFRTLLPPLEYVQEKDGLYAVYRLKKGEALYSAVVVNFTGALLAEDANKLASELARLNGIRDVTDIKVGQAIRIPADLLLPEFLPANDPQRLEYEKDREESKKYSNTVRASRLEGITVILDAGHGGQDPGSSVSGVWESTYVYDITMRVKQLLERETSARVVSTVREGNQFEVSERDVLRNSRGRTVLTSPPYAITDAKVSANLRWYLANSQHKKAVKENQDDAKSIFLSIHADSLHQSHRGMMAYIPAASLTKGKYGKSGGEYSKRKEVREQQFVSYTWKERTRSEGLSRQFANHLLTTFRRHGLSIHQDKPIRDRIIRCRRCNPWVPAVVRYNAVPTKLLLEVCNLNNGKDRGLLKTRAFRQKVAVATVDAILAYYGQEALGDEQVVAATR
jgi:N-acetylmuramoyl-L-alanine amidase